jgi:mycofactocin system transcriptional regulator
MSEITARGRGRPPLTTRKHIARVALQLFVDRGFDETTMDEIAAELGIARRTLFRYYASKNDLVWGEFEQVLERLHVDLRAIDQDRAIMAVIREAAVRSNTYPDDLLDELHLRLTLIQTVPALQAHSMLRYAAWRRVVARYVAECLGCGADELVPIVAGHAALGASTAAFSRWVSHRGENVLELIDRSYGLLADGFAIGKANQSHK